MKLFDPDNGNLTALIAGCLHSRELTLYLIARTELSNTVINGHFISRRYHLALSIKFIDLYPMDINKKIILN